MGLGVQRIEIYVDININIEAGQEVIQALLERFE